MTHATLALAIATLAGTAALADPSPLAPTEGIRPSPHPEGLCVRPIAGVTIEMPRAALEREIIEKLRERLRGDHNPEVWI